MSNLFQKIPQVNELVKSNIFQDLCDDYGHACVVEACRKELDCIRRKISAGDITEQNFEKKIDDIFSKVNNRLKKLFAPAPCSVINATGTILHTNLGRSPLSTWQLDGLQALEDSYCNLEFDLDCGKRGSRQDHIDALLSNVTGAEANVVVNNNAAAVLLVLCSLGAASEVIISRGELVEIGGKFRIPDVLAQSGCKLVEVGTTNKTRLEDYESAITEKTAAIIKVHTSNFKVVGFTESASIEDLTKLAHRHDLIMVEDIGSGLLVDLTRYGLDEPTVQQSVAAGVDIVCYSGDKLLGGPQAGIISGKANLVDKIKCNQLMRALRVGKLELSVLRNTLLLYLDQKRALEEVPVLNMIKAKSDVQRKKAEQIFVKFSEIYGFAEIVPAQTCIGGGSMPGKTIPSYAIALKFLAIGADKLLEMLRFDEAHVIGYVKNDVVMLDLRTVFGAQLDLLGEALVRVVRRLQNA